MAVSGRAQDCSEAELTVQAALVRNGERSISVPSHRSPLASKCSALAQEKLPHARWLQEIHQIGSVIRSREFWPERTLSDIFAPGLVNSQPRITHENNEKIRSRLGSENEFAGASGGETGIRTLETVSRLHTFQACAFDHSATSPVRDGVAGTRGGMQVDIERKSHDAGTSLSPPVSRRSACSRGDCGRLSFPPCQG